MLQPQLECTESTWLSEQGQYLKLICCLILWIPQPTPVWEWQESWVTTTAGLQHEDMAAVVGHRLWLPSCPSSKLRTGGCGTGSPRCVPSPVSKCSVSPLPHNTHTHTTSTKVKLDGLSRVLWRTKTRKPVPLPACLPHVFPQTQPWPLAGFKTTQAHPLW